VSAPYLVLAWPDDVGQAETPSRLASDLSTQGWFRSHRVGRLEVWSRSERPATVVWCEASAAVVIGRSIRRSARGECKADQAVVARAQALCARVWGAYVAIFQDGAPRGIWAFRDPSGALDAVAWKRGELQVLASGVADLPRSLWPDRFALDWDVIADHVARPISISARSALSGIEALTPGTLHRLDDVKTCHAIWRPSQWAPQSAEVEPDLAERLVETMCGVVGALAGDHPTILCEASGGLDSSIVLAGMVASGLSGRVAGLLNYVGDRPESDEGRWAGLLADQWRLPLQVGVRELSPFDPEQDFALLAGDVRPPVSALDTWRDRDTADRLRASGATALVTGMGGDAALFQMPTALILADLWRARGVSGAGDPIVGELARWLRRSIWSIGGEALRHARRPPAQRFAFLGPRARGLPRAAAHPWLEDLSMVPPAKQLQIEGFAALQRTSGRNRRAMAAEVIHPLMSQPVMELCLSIPSWVQVRGGRDRGLAREAFRPLLPADVVDRRSKGALTSHFSRRVAASLDALRPHLLDGVLASAGVLDRRAMEAALDADSLLWRADGLDLIMAAAVESWVRHWQRYVPDSLSAPRDRDWGP
jgi:asparagine synthase (glutamine-hydrolysing)